MLGRRSVHTFTETVPKYAFARASPAPVPRRVPLPTRPMPISELRTPEQTSTISVTPSIQSILPETHNASPAMWRNYAGHEDAWTRQTRRATASATATAFVALSLSLGLFYARCTDPLHAESIHGNPISTQPACLTERNARRGFSCVVDQIQFVKDAAQLGPI